LKDAVLEEIAELLFILASIDRLQLLSEIGVKKSRLGELTNKISATPQETSKHLMRLRSAQFLENKAQLGRIIHKCDVVKRLHDGLCHI
jgi:predicted transcriptional regulator